MKLKNNIQTKQPITIVYNSILLLSIITGPKVQIQDFDICKKSMHIKSSIRGPVKYQDFYLTVIFILHKKKKKFT